MKTTDFGLIKEIMRESREKKSHMPLKNRTDII